MKASTTSQSFTEISLSAAYRLGAQPHQTALTVNAGAAGARRQIVPWINCTGCLVLAAAPLLRRSRDPIRPGARETCAY